jgi:hypothetical protein
VIVHVDPTSGSATLSEPTDCKRFHVEAPANAGDARDEATLATVLGTPAGAPDGHVWVPVDWVRGQAAGRVPDGWAADFDGMVAFAASKGWLSDDRRFIQAHVEWV